MSARAVDHGGAATVALARATLSDARLRTATSLSRGGRGVDHQSTHAQQLATSYDPQATHAYRASIVRAARARQRRKQDCVGVIFRDGHYPHALQPSVDAGGAMVGTGTLL